MESTLTSIHPSSTTSTPKYPMPRTYTNLPTLISNSAFKQRCRPFQQLHATRRPHRQLSSKPPPDNLSNLSPLDNLHAARDDFGRRRRRVLIPVASIAAILSLASAFYFNSQSPTVNDKIFDRPRFTSFTIVDRKVVSSTAFILTVHPQHQNGVADDAYKEEWEKGVWSVEVKQPLLQIARNYTPLPPSPPSSQQNNAEVQFLIRKERGGEVSNYLAGLPVGATVELRGPHWGFDLAGNPVKEVLFLAGGTGIAPALQVIYTLLERRANEEAPRVCVVWANRRREDCIAGVNSTPKHLQQATANIIVKQLEDLREKYPGTLRVEYVVDEEGTFLDQKLISALTKNRGEVKYGATTSRIDEKLLFVSGPEGFVTYLAGAKKWEGGVETQGELGGVLGKLGVRGWRVWKL